MFYTLVRNASAGDNFGERNPDQELSSTAFRFP